MNKITKICLSLAVAFASVIGLTTAITAPVHAVDICTLDSVGDEVKAAAGCPGYGSSTELPIVIRNILSAIIGVMGLVAVIFVVIGAVQYITSTGDAAKLQKAKNTILYALIGLAICALAFAIVNFAVGIVQSE